MLNYAVLFLLSVRAFGDAPCCKEKERSMSYLDIAIESISKARNSMPGCQGEQECPEIKATDCADWYERGHNGSGLYSIRPMSRLTSNKSLSVFCDMDTDGGGWTVIQRRGNFGRPDDYFYKDWSSYKEGFGDVDRDFWLGNDNIFALTNQKAYSIRFDLQERNLQKVFAAYSNFWIDDESNKYMLHIFNWSAGNTSDDMHYHDKRKFSTHDQDNSEGQNNCAKSHKSAWWYRNCYYVDLNGLYNTEKGGLHWSKFRNTSTPSLIWAEMKIRPKNFAPVIFRLSKGE